MPTKRIALISQRLSILVLLALAGCAAPPPMAERPELVFPDPPDEARFVFEHSIRSNIDIEGETEDEIMTRFLTGVSRGAEGFAKPFDVTVNKGRIFVSDTVQSAVIMIDHADKIFRKITNDLPIPIGKPMGLDTDDQGNLFVMDSVSREALMFNRDGKFLKRLGDPSLLSRPTGIAVNPEGTLLFIVDVGGVSSNLHNLQVFDIASGKHIKTIGTRGSEEGTFNLPKDAVIGKDGLIYVVDSGNFRVSVLDQDGNHVRSFGKIGLEYGKFSRPKGISLDPDGNIYVIDAGFGNFQIFNKEGQLLMFIGERSSRGDRAEYMLPAGIDVDEDGRVYVVDQYHAKLEIYRPAALADTDGYLGKVKRMEAEAKLKKLKPDAKAAEKSAAKAPE